jgi:hypothetical protein
VDAFAGEEFLDLFGVFAVALCKNSNVMVLGQLLNELICWQFQFMLLNLRKEV